MDIKYVVSVKRIVDTAATGEEPRITETVLADFTGGPVAASVLLASLAETIQKGKKPLGWALALKAVADILTKENEKARAEGRPTFSDAVKDLLDPKPGNTAR